MYVHITCCLLVLGGWGGVWIVFKKEWGELFIHRHVGDLPGFSGTAE